MEGKNRPDEGVSLHEKGEIGALLQRKRRPKSITEKYERYESYRVRADERRSARQEEDTTTAREAARIALSQIAASPLSRSIQEAPPPS